MLYQLSYAHHYRRRSAVYAFRPDVSSPGLLNAAVQNRSRRFCRTIYGSHPRAALPVWYARQDSNLLPSA